MKNLIKAYGLTVITFGASHLMVAYYLMLTSDYNEGNLFRILNFNKLLPGIDIGWQNFIISNVVAVSLYVVVLGVIMYRDRKYMQKPQDA